MGQSGVAEMTNWASVKFVRGGELNQCVCNYHGKLLFKTDHQVIVILPLHHHLPQLVIYIFFHFIVHWGGSYVGLHIYFQSIYLFFCSQLTVFLGGLGFISARPPKWACMTRWMAPLLLLVLGRGFGDLWVLVKCKQGWVI